METKVNALFRLRRDAAKREGKSPIYLRITIAGKQWLSIIEKDKTILAVFQEHNDKMWQLVGPEFAEGTMERYQTSFDHTKRFLREKYGIEDIELKNLDYKFITDYEFWLKTVRKCAHNTAMKYLSNFRKIVFICVKNGWLNKDPFLGYKMMKKEVKRDFLTEIELETMRKKVFSVTRLERVRDIFLFACYTGLAYADVKKLTKSEIREGLDGRKWIFTHRRKTDTLSRIPLLSASLEILEKYADHPECVNSNRLCRFLPIKG